MKGMFGIRYIVDAKLSRPFRAEVSWLRHFIGLHPMLRYVALSGLFGNSPERAVYTSEAVSPLANSPKGARYTNDGCSSSGKNKKTITSPERAVYTSEAVSSLSIKSKTS